MSIKYTSNIYNDFLCSADKCPRTCCGQWTITVDENFCNQIQKHQNKLGITPSEYVRADNGTYSIIFDDNGFCKFLDECGLCSIVLELDDKSLSKTCASFPRDEIKGSLHTDLSLSICCPEVVKMLIEYKEVLFYEENDASVTVNPVYAYTLEKRKYTLDIFKMISNKYSKTTGAYLAFRFLSQAIDALCEESITDERLSDIHNSYTDQLGQSINLQLNTILDPALKYDLWCIISNHLCGLDFPSQTHTGQSVHRITSFITPNNKMLYLKSFDSFSLSMSSYKAFEENLILFRLHPFLFEQDNYSSLLIDFAVPIIEYAILEMSWYELWTNNHGISHESLTITTAEVSRILRDQRISKILFEMISQTNLSSIDSLLTLLY